MNVPAPISRYRYVTPWAILLSAALTAALMLLRPGSGMMLWMIWGVSGVLSLILWNIISQFNLHDDAPLRTFAISWPLLAGGMQFVYCYYPLTDSYYKVLLLHLALMLVINLELSLWQHHKLPRKATSKHLLLGFIIGLVSAMQPHALLWLLMLPISSFFMRCWSPRSLFSGLTGTAIAIWIAYCVLFFVSGSEAASRMLQDYALILQDEDFGSLFASLGYFQYLYLALVILLIFFYGISGLTLGVGQSTYTKSCIQLLSTLSFLMVLLLFFDVGHFFSGLSLLSQFIALQLTIHQANVKATVHEWWIVVAIIGCMALCLLPQVC